VNKNIGKNNIFVVKTSKKPRTFASEITKPTNKIYEKIKYDIYVAPDDADQYLCRCKSSIYWRWYY
jgi:hypothetical protein